MQARSSGLRIKATAVVGIMLASGFVFSDFSFELFVGMEVCDLELHNGLLTRKIL